MDVWSMEMFEQQTGSPLSTLCLITKTKVLLLCLSFVEGTLMQMLRARNATMKELALIYLTKVVFFVSLKSKVRLGADWSRWRLTLGTSVCRCILPQTLAKLQVSDASLKGWSVDFSPEYFCRDVLYICFWFLCSTWNYIIFILNGVELGMHRFHFFTSTYIWVLAATEYRNEYIIIQLQVKEPVNPLSKREFKTFAM